MSRRFGSGDYYQIHDGEDDATAEARDFFVDVVASEIPRVVETFILDVSSLLDGVWDKCREHPLGVTFNTVSTSLGLQDAIDAPLSMGDPCNVSHWAGEWNLSENPWFTLRLVSRSLLAFRVREGLHSPDKEADSTLADWIWVAATSDLQTRLPLDSPPPEKLVLPGWDPTAETWGDYRQRIEGELVPALLSEERARVQEDDSFRRTPEKVYARQHFHWLARWQILGESYRSLAEAEKQPQDSLRNAVRRTADLVGLQRRTL